MINGILNLYKPAGWTSNDVVCKLRGILHQKKIGHTGTLDPDAVGVLPVCIGNATKVCDLLTDHEKEYTAVMRLGITTDTQDTSGSILSERPVSCSFAEICEAADSFAGSYEQLPPMYSARKVNGKKLYEYAREGIEVERRPKTVTIYEIRVQSYEGNSGFESIGDAPLPNGKAENFAVLHVRCSKGTYIRTLIHDMGERLGCGAAMAALTRTRVGIFSIDNTVTLQKVQELSDAGRAEEYVTGADALFSDASACIPADERTLAGIRNGNAVSPSRLIPTGSSTDLSAAGVPLPEQLRLYDHAGNFLALYRYDRGRSSYIPLKMFVTGA